MENCYYQGKILCTYELKDSSGYYYEDKVLEWKEAAALRQLTCVECHAPVYLAAGPVKEPYFAHYDIEACEYDSGSESEELKKGKRLLYQLLKRSFPDSNIQAHYRLENGMYGTLFSTDGEHRIAVDYRLQNTSLEKFRERDNYYQAKQIPVLYILGKRRIAKTDQPDWYQTLVQKSMGYLAFLDAQKETLTLKRSISYRFGKERRFKILEKTYPIGEVTVDWTTSPVGSFTEECERLLRELEQEKLSYQKAHDRLKALKEEKRQLEEAELERMEAYRRSRKQEEQGLTNVEQLDDVSSGELLHFKRPDDLSEEELLAMGLNPSLYRKCLAMVREGNSDLVSAKYLEVIKRRGGIQYK